MKKLRKILIFLLLLLIILIVIFIIFWKDNGASKNQNKYYDSTKELEEDEVIIKYTPLVETRYSKIMDNYDKLNLEDAIDTILTLLNTKEYETLYQKLNEKTKDFLYPTGKDFENYLSKKMENYEYTCSDYVADFYGYECVFYPKDADEYNEENEICMIITFDTDSKTYNISMEYLLDVRRTSVLDIVDKVTVTYIAELEYSYKTAYVLSFYNHSDTNLQIDFDKIYAIKISNGYESNEYIETPNGFFLEPGESKELILEFETFTYKSQKPKWLNIDFKINKKIVKSELYMSYEYYREEI